MKVGMVGAGGISHVHIDAWKRLGADLVVYSKRGAPQLVSEHGYGRVVGSLDQLLDDCEVVDVVTPTYTHPELVEMALERGRDVICEKPLALDVQTARRLVELAARLGQRLFVAHVVRYFPAYATLKDAVDRSEIGEVAVARFSRVSAPPDWADWFKDEDLSGGVILDLAVHDIDFARWMNGEVVDVYATLRRTRAKSGAPQAMTHIVMRHRNGAITEIDGGWGAQSTKFFTSFNVAGTRGVLQYDTRLAGTILLDVDSDSRGATLPSLDEVESPYLTEIRDFAQAREQGRAARVTGEDAIEAIRLAQLARLSVERGVPVAVEDGSGG